ncbi:MAG: hypothetical protein WDO24_05080 [Pseudomonadota bacterium]
MAVDLDRLRDVLEELSQEKKRRRNLGQRFLESHDEVRGELAKRGFTQEEQDASATVPGPGPCPVTSMF